MPGRPIKSCCLILIPLALISLVAPSQARAQSAAFTYQGRLTDAGSPANNAYDFQFKLFNTPDVGTGEELGIQTRASVNVSNGVFAVVLDFGEEVFDGSDRFLEIAIRPAGSIDPYTVLGPRQPITASPYAVRSVKADSAEIAANATLLGGLPSSGFVQNTTAQQLATSFNISGSGTASILNATTQFNLGGSRILSAGAGNLLAGIGAGANNTTGVGNSFFGDGAGASNTTGGFNAIFGKGAGANNTTASGNSFFGTSAGFNNTTGQLNAFFGEGTGSANTTGSGNTFIGRDADFDAASPTGDNNTLVGSNSRVSSGVSNSTAIGAGVKVSTSDTIVLGTNAQTTRIPGKLIMGGGPVMGGPDVIAQSFTSSVFFGIFTGNLVLQGSALNNVLPSTVHLCIRGLSLGNGFGGEALSRCTSSLSSTRYKSAMEPFSGGLDVINRLRPVTFTWKEGGERDFGLSAEDVAEVEPLLVTRNAKGEVEDVKHETMLVVFINAIKQQQQQIDLLKKIVCADHPDAEVCRPAR